MELKIKQDRVLLAAKENPESAKLLETLLPEAFEDSKVFCRIGTAFKRDTHPGSIYAVFKKSGLVRMVDITNNILGAGKYALRVHELKDTDGKTLTVSEFKKLAGYINIDGVKLLNPAELRKTIN